MSTDPITINVMERVAEPLSRGDVTLRRWCGEDIPVLHAVVSASIHHLAPWMPWAADGYTERDARTFIERSREMWTRDKEFDYAVSVPDSGLVGSCGLVVGAHGGKSAIGLRNRTVGEASPRGLRPCWSTRRSESVSSRSTSCTTAPTPPAAPSRVDLASPRSRRPAPEPWTSGQAGTFVVWRRVRG